MSTLLDDLRKEIASRYGWMPERLRRTISVDRVLLAAATSVEGWGVWGENNGPATDDGPVQIASLGGSRDLFPGPPPAWRSDGDVWMHVFAKAQAGSPLHLTAMHVLLVTNPVGFLVTHAHIDARSLPADTSPCEGCGGAATLTLRFDGTGSARGATARSCISCARNTDPDWTWIEP